MKKIWVSVLIIAAATVACKKGQKEYAVAFSGIVNFSQGVVKFEKDGTSGVLKAGDTVEEGMKVITVGDKSFAEIYLDQNAIKVLGNSTLVFTKLALTSSGQVTDLYVQNGSVFSKVMKKLEKGDQYNVKTPHSVAAVRGTDFYVVDDGKKANIACVDGKVEVKDAALDNRSVVLDGKEEVDVAGSDLVKKQISDDRMNILKNISDIRELQGEIRQKYEDQKNDMRRRFEEERDQMRKAVTDQKEKDKAMIEAQKAKDKANIEDQKARDKQNIEDIKGTSKGAADQSVGDAKKAMDSSKADTSSAKKAADDAKAAVKPKVDVNQFKKQ